MRDVLGYVDQKTREYERLPLFAFMRDSAIAADERLGFVPCLAHFVMTFADLYSLVLRREPAPDKFQELVNAHTYEDGGHWKWFLADLQALGHDTLRKTSETLRFVWGEETVKSRMLAYRMCRLGYGANSLQRLVLVHCIEAAGKVSLEAVVPIGREMGQRVGRSLLYFGPHHFDTESDHTLEDDAVRESLEVVKLPEPDRKELVALVDEAFSAFTDFSVELHRFAEARRKT